MYIAKNDLRNVIFEGVSASAITAISQESTVLTSFGNIVDDIRALVFVFQFFQFHVNRTCNVVADALAKKAKKLSGVLGWLGGLPEGISQLVGFDVP